MANNKRFALAAIVLTTILGAYGTVGAQPSSPSPSASVTSPAATIAAPTAPITPTLTPTVPPIIVPNTPLDPLRAQILTKDLSDLRAMIAGRWDNELQTFFEPELNVPTTQRHDRLHIIVRPIEASPFGAHAFYVEYRSGGESGSIVRQRIWILSLDPQLAALRLATLTPKDGKPLENAWQDPAKLTSLNPADFITVSGCDVIWRRRVDGFSGETRPGACKIMTGGEGQRVVTVTERHDVSPNTWDVRDIGVDDRGTRLFGSADSVPTRLKRAAAFVCWAGARRGSEAVSASDLILHDQGGVVTAALPGAMPSSVTLRLRNVDWPIGQNRPSLTLYLMTGSDTDAKAYAWSEPDAKRIALDVGGTQASCTRDERALWR